MTDFRVKRLLDGLNDGEYRPRPKGTGQKSVNIAQENGWIEGRKSKEDGRLPDLHRLTPEGVVARAAFTDCPSDG